MIRNIVFDMGGVLIDFCPQKTAASITQNPEDANLIMREVFESKEWQLIDEGIIDDESATEAMCNRLPKHLHSACRQAMSIWQDDMSAIDGALELVQEIKSKGYKVYLCSNTSLKFRTFSKNYPVFDLMDGLLISAEEKCVKPNKVIFDKLFDKFSLDSKQCIFIDDRPENVSAGVDCGMTGIVFDGKISHLRQGLILRGIGVHK